MKKKKGFTIVELIIVIAVIGVLSAILIPTYVSLVNKARQASDSALVYNLNTTMQSYVALNGESEEGLSITEAVSALLDNGYDITKIAASSENSNIVYDETTQSFVLLTNNFEENSDVPTTDKLVVIGCSTSIVQTAYESVYQITNYYVYSDSDTSIECTYNQDINLYLYTDGGSVTLNMPYTTVEHYGTASVVEITEVAENSYHLYGEVNQINLTKGKVELKSSSVVETLSVADADYSRTIVWVKGATLGTIVSNVSGLTDSDFPYSFYVKDSDDSETTEELTSIASNIYTTTKATLSLSMVLSEDVALTSVLTVPANVEVSLDLNGHTLSSSTSTTIKVNSGASLTITDSQENGTIKSTYSDETWVIVNLGTLNIKSGTIESEYVAVEVNENSTATIDGGTITGLYTIANRGGTLYINDGYIYGDEDALETYDNGTTTINGGKFTTGEYGTVIYNNDNHTLTINGGTITNDWVGIANNATLIVNGGTINGDDTGINNGYYDDEDYYAYGYLTINSGSISGDYVAVYNWYGNLSVTGGTLTSSEYGIFNQSLATVSGGTIYSEEVGIYAYSAITVSGNTTITVTGNNSSSGTIICGIYVTSANNGYSGTLYINSSDTTITATNSAGKSYGIYCGSSGSASILVQISNGTISGGTSSVIKAASFSGTITITGGTFNSDPSDYVATNYTANSNGDGTYTVSKNS